MAVAWSYTPPKVNAALALAAAAPAATRAAAEHILDVSRRDVPVEDGVLKASGRVDQEGTRAYFTYGRDDDGTDHHAPSNQYVLIQHEDLTLNHPNGGSAKWLERAMHSERAAVAELVAHTLARMLR